MELILTARIFIIISGFYVKMTLGSRFQGEELNDVNMSTIEIIQKYGYPAETHSLESEDGYNLTLHRIPHGKNSNSTGFPILVGHGIVADSAEFVIYGSKSLGFYLADDGYDVWLGNIRGNIYSRSHKFLHPNETKFWDFSWHEHGVYDLPAFINYITNHTQNPDILFLAHSMGCTSFFVMASERPEYQKKIRGAALLAPVATLRYIRSPLRIFAPFSRVFQALAEKFTKGELNVQSPEYQNLVITIRKFPFFQRYFIKNLLFLLAGFDYRGFDERTLPNFLSHTPSTASTKTIMHYAQLVTSGKFRQYNYGLSRNLNRYNRSTPPEYHLERITTPMCLFLASNDYFATPQDAIITLSGLPSVKSIYFVPRKDFTHFDFILGKDVIEILYRNVSERLKYLMNQGRAVTNK